ncbi:MAG: hypothetical protein ACT4QC_04765 [Planctomycetaceae bacterium]
MEQIPDDYDLFIGMMWYRFGTATGRAGSGTVEEFERAKARFDRDPTTLQIMMYFKNAPAPIAPTKLDHTQLAKIAEFQTNLGKEGGLHWSFTSLDDFEKLVRMHLTRHVQSWRSKQAGTHADVGVKRQPEAAHQEATLAAGVEDESGIIDLMEQFEDEFAMATEITERIAVATKEIAEKMEVRAREVRDATPAVGSLDRKAAKRLVERAAADMDQYTYRMGAELPLLSQAAIMIDFVIGPESQSQLTDNLEAVHTFQTTLSMVAGQITSFRNVVSTIPRMTTRLNKSKRALVTVLQRLIDELTSAQAMAREAETSFASIIHVQVASTDAERESNGSRP